MKIFSKYLYTWIGKNIWIKSYVQLVLSISFAFFPQPVWIGTDTLAISTAADDCFQLVPIYDWKWNWKGVRHSATALWKLSKHLFSSNFDERRLFVGAALSHDVQAAKYRFLFDDYHRHHSAQLSLLSAKTFVINIIT